MGDNASTSLKGKLLVSMPQLLDPSFHRTVTCMTEHAPEGAVGVIVNRVIPELTADKIFKELEIKHGPGAENIPVHFGGPVREIELFVLHGPPFDWKGTYRFTPSLALSGAREILDAIAAGEGPQDFIISLGCAEWGGNQLESELKQNAWLTCDMMEDLMFRAPMDDRWEMAVRGMGIDPAALSDTAGHA